mgnify:FL=1
MENRIDTMAAKSEMLLRYCAIVYLFVALYYFMILPKFSGDEPVFIADLHLIHDSGWYDALVKNISIPYMLLVYPFSFIMEDYIALRIVNVGLVVLLLLYFYYVSKFKFNSFYSYLLFFISTVGYFYYGTNDCLIFVSMIVFFNEVHRAVNKKDVNFNLALTALVIAFFTRELFLVYLPVVFLGLYILFTSGCKFSTKTFIPVGLVLFFVILNIPSIQKNGTLSYDRKTPPREFHVTWPQRNYLSQLRVNEGTLKNGQHVGWQETQDYLDANGKDSLPVGNIEGIILDWKLTMTEFFKDFATTIVNSFRSLGFMLLLSMLYWFHQSKKNKIIDFKYFVPFSTLVMMMIFSFIIICFPDLRWLSPVFVMTLVYYSELHEHKSISKYFILANTLVLCVFSVYGIVRIFMKL